MDNLPYAEHCQADKGPALTHTHIWSYTCSHAYANTRESTHVTEGANGACASTSQTWGKAGCGIFAAGLEVFFHRDSWRISFGLTRCGISPDYPRFVLFGGGTAPEFVCLKSQTEFAVHKTRPPGAFY